MKIDLVYNWVDESDETYKNNKSSLLEQLNIEEEFYNIDLGLSSEKLKYSLRSAQINAPWINHIYIISPNGAPPSWMDSTNISSKITLISHKDIMPKESLPTFNNYAVDFCLDNIPSLSEHFLYATENMFFTFPVKTNYFFDRNKNPYVYMRRHYWDNQIKENNLYVFNLNYTFALAKWILRIPSAYQDYEPSCGIMAFRKSYFSECKEIFEQNIIETINTQLPQKKLIHNYLVHLFICREKGAVVREYPAFELQDEFDQLETMFLTIPALKHVLEKIKNGYPKLLTIIDNEEATEKDIECLKSFLERTFPAKQIWEK